MAETRGIHVIAMRCLYAALALIIIFFQLIPLETIPRSWAPPDLLLALTFAWALRRPAVLPPLLIAAVFLLADLMFHRPPGLWAALVVGGTEWLKSRTRQIREHTLSTELANALTTLALITLADRAILVVLLSPVPPLGLSLSQFVMTALAIPILLLLSHYAFGMRRMRPSEIGAMGAKL